MSDLILSGASERSCRFEAEGEGLVPFFAFFLPKIGFGSRGTRAQARKVTEY